MPIYEYRCQQCGHELEKLQKISDAPLVDCPQCEQDSLKKLVSAAGFRLKGGGWYETDFKRDNKRNLADNGKEAGKEAKTGGDKSAGSDNKKSSSKQDSSKVGKADAA